MPTLTIHGRRLCYNTEGDGFPLILVPDVLGTLQDWRPVMPLLGELCRVLAYAYEPPGDAPGPSPVLDVAGRSTDLRAFLDALDIERAYLAGYAQGGQAAWRLAQDAPERLEALILLGQEAHAIRPPPAAGLRETPTLLIAGAHAPAHVAGVTHLAAQIPRSAVRLLDHAGPAPHREQPLPLGHLMGQFLLQCERQRTLVRGASFLL